jgi:hypothetical protein
MSTAAERIAKIGPEIIGGAGGTSGARPNARYMIGTDAAQAGRMKAALHAQR